MTPSSSSPPLVPTSLTRVARPGTPAPGQFPTLPTQASTLQAPTSGSAPTLISPQVPALGPRLTPALVPGGAPPPQAYGQPPGYNALGNAPIKDSYPAIGHLEQVTLGSSSPTENIDHRLASLENAIFKKTFEYDSLFDRTERLKRTVLGTQEVDPNSAAGREEAAAGRSGGRLPGATGGAAGSTAGSTEWIDNPHPALESLTEVHYLDEQAALPENMTAASAPELGQYAVSLLNRERQAYGVAAVTPDNVAEQMAGELASDLAKRNVLSHFNSAGDGPDRRLTLLESADALNEGIASVKTAEVGSKRMCKAAVARILKTMLGRQDDRDALLNPDATHVGFALALTADRERVVAAVEVLTRHAIMIPVASDVKVGDKIEVRGVLQSPYLFDKVTVAWESYNPEAAASAPDESEEALPYFPPLDYIAYSSRSEGNHDKAMLLLKTGLIVGAVGAGLFFPPAAMAVPLIALSGGPSEIKPVSDIPVKGGIKVDGGSFAGHIPLSNNSKPGLYYVTVWAVQAKGQKSVPISRRVLLAKAPTPEEQDASEQAEEKLKEERKVAERKEKEERKQKQASEKQKQVDEKQRHAVEKQEKRRDKDNKSRDLTVEGEVEPGQNSQALDSKALDSKVLDSKVPESKVVDSKNDQQNDHSKGSVNDRD
ncbi:MAG: CAP domain-containing protein [Candidatus Obscuribacterales bacterium]